MQQISIYTDGASRGNPGPGGYGVVLQFGNHRKELAAGYRLTTNNRMELLAVIVALETLTIHHYPTTVYSDSKYVIDSITKGWLQGWIQKGFKGKKNKDLWLRYAAVATKFPALRFQWVKGHAGHPENERCDFLATQAAQGSLLLVDEMYEQEEASGLFES